MPWLHFWIQIFNCFDNSIWQLPVITLWHSHLIQMVCKIIYNIHNIMLSQMMEWCSSYRTMVLTMWLCLIAILYVFFVFLFKTLRLNKKKENDILMTLCNAIEANDIVKCVRLLEEHPHYINKYTKNGYTPFLIACANGNTQLVKLMLKKGKYLFGFKKIKNFSIRIWFSF